MIRKEDEIYAVCIGINFFWVFPDRLTFQSGAIFLYVAKIARTGKTTSVRSVLKCYFAGYFPIASAINLVPFFFLQEYCVSQTKLVWLFHRDLISFIHIEDISRAVFQVRLIPLLKVGELEFFVE